ncbi:MAG: HD domain-containing protein [Firmicutes bacterium]|nr:HD domain-containing protein [Bacillota bacterium]
MNSDFLRRPLTTTEKLNFKEIPAWVTQAVVFLRENQKMVYLVGGAVRDLIWGSTPSDWDLATDALPDEIEKIFPKTLPTGKRFGTITIFSAGQPIQITTIREDFPYSDGRRPDQVLFGSDIVKDLARRDFTINAMAYDFETQALIDPFNGRADCYRRLLKAVGNPRDRFREDGLRMFRFYRFLASHSLAAERKTEGAINPEWAKFVSYERIRDEFSKLLLGASIRKGLAGLAKSGLLLELIPEFYSADKAQSRLYSYLREHSFSAAAAIQRLLPLRLAALLHDIAKPASLTITKTGPHFYGHERAGAEMSRVILERLRYPKKLIQKVSLLINGHMFFYQPNISDSAVRRLISNIGPENIPDLLELRRADIIATGKINPKTLEHWKDLSQRVLAVLRSKSESKNGSKLAINGADLIEKLGVKPGPLMGEILSYLNEQIIEEPDLNQENRLLEITRQYLDSKNLRD